MRVEKEPASIPEEERTVLEKPEKKLGFIR
jgi:hypothetical protein